VDLGGYVASGVVCFDLHTRTVRWRQHLDLSTDGTAAKAFTYSAPTLADLDGDGKLEIAIGTSMARPGLRARPARPRARFRLHGRVPCARRAGAVDPVLCVAALSARPCMSSRAWRAWSRSAQAQSAGRLR